VTFLISLGQFLFNAQILQKKKLYHVHYLKSVHHFLLSPIAFPSSKMLCSTISCRKFSALLSDQTLVGSILVSPVYANLIFFKLANYGIFIRNKIFPPFPFLPNIPTPIYLTNLHVQFPHKAMSILLKWWCHGQHGRFLANRHRQFVANGTIGRNGVLILRTFSLPTHHPPKN